VRTDGGGVAEGGRQVERVGHARDRYGRLLAVCYVAGESINDRLVREGWALDYRPLRRRVAI
jgi:endonuclease YncB( thermonuclease family)